MKRHHLRYHLACRSIGIWISELLTHVKRIRGWLVCPAPGIAIFGFRSRHQTEINSRNATETPITIPAQAYDLVNSQRAANILNEAMPQWVSVRACVQIQPSPFADERADTSLQTQTVAVIIRSGGVGDARGIQPRNQQG